MTRQRVDNHEDASDVVRCPPHAASPVLPLSELRAEAERLIATLGLGVLRVRLRAGPNVVEVDWDAGPDGARSAAPQPVQPGGDKSASGADLAERAGTPVWLVRSPLVGTFYTAPTPGAPEFVAIGDEVRAGQQLAIIEAMKLMNPIVADRPGRVTAIGAADGAMVEFDEVLFELTPLGEG